jgi:phosphoribosylcarboxyaminoimidazole (NCAIR) mutase
MPSARTALDHGQVGLRVIIAGADGVAHLPGMTIDKIRSIVAKKNLLPIGTILLLGVLG